MTFVASSRHFFFTDELNKFSVSREREGTPFLQLKPHIVLLRQVYLMRYEINIKPSVINFILVAEQLSLCSYC